MWVGAEVAAAMVVMVAAARPRVNPQPQMETAVGRQAVSVAAVGVVGTAVGR